MSYRLVIYRRVIVNLRDEDRAVEGVLVKQKGPLIFLKDAVLHEAGQGSTPLDGEILIERERIDFIQALT